jgi:hypothetical protein
MTTIANMETTPHAFDLSYQDMGYGDVAMSCPRRSSETFPPPCEDMGYEYPPAVHSRKAPTSRGVNKRTSTSSIVALENNRRGSVRRGSLTYSNEVNDLPRAVRRCSKMNITDPQASPPRRLCRRASMSQ